MKWNEKIKSLKPYVPNENNCDIRLDANESFIGLSQETIDEICEEIQKISFNRYPDPMAAKACTAFADFYEVNAENVVCGNGSDELIGIIFSTFLQKGDKYATILPDFSMYSFYGHLAETQEVVIEKEENFEVNIDRVIETCNNNNVKMLIFSNPCNPTSLGIKKEEIRRLIENVNCLVVLDEAYMDFWDQSLLNEHEKYENLIILRTCSKALAIAGMRVGFAVASKFVIDVIKAAKSPYNVNLLSQKMAEIILKDKEKMQKAIKLLVASRKSLATEMQEIENFFGIFEILESETNFLSLKMDNAKQLANFLEEKGIAVRHTGGLVRITAGTMKENAAVLEAVQQYARSC